MKTITLHERTYSITLRAEDIVATTRTAHELNIFMRGCDQPFILRNTNNFDDWYNAIWEDNNESS